MECHRARAFVQSLPVITLNVLTCMSCKADAITASMMFEVTTTPLCLPMSPQKAQFTSSMGCKQLGQNHMLTIKH